MFRSLPAASSTMTLGVIPTGVVPFASYVEPTSVLPVTVGAVTLVELPDHVAENGAVVIVCVGTCAPGTVMETEESVRPEYRTGVARTVSEPERHGRPPASVACVGCVTPSAFVIAAKELVRTTPSTFASVNCVLFVALCAEVVVAVALSVH